MLEPGQNPPHTLPDLIRAAATGLGGHADPLDGRWVVTAEVTCRAETWVWADDLVSRSGGTLVATGLAWERRVRARGELFNRADHAACLSRERGMICTWDMVAAYRTADALGARTDLAPPDRARELLRRRWGFLGASQRAHLTEHCELVSDAAAGLARAMGQVPAAINAARVAGLLHDLGKIVIPDELLARPGVLSAAERRIMERHAEEGAAIAGLLGADREVVDAIRLHHARFDQSPGLPGAARVLAVADALVTMTTDRPYQEARTLHGALAELMRMRGTTLDPDAVAAAFRLGRTRIALAA
ncbi:MAG: HD domain-containing protein [Phycisphaerales bacterium]|nr:HD domain-containing protein [Phycisphaerales bacterium]